MFRYQESIDICSPSEGILTWSPTSPAMVTAAPNAGALNGFGEPAQAVTGVRFRGQNRRRVFTWWRQATITRAERGHEFAFKTEPGHGIYHDTTIWHYRFEPITNGTNVTESYELTAPWWIKFLDTMLGRRKTMRKGAHRTLGNLKHTAEAAAGD